MNSPELLQKLLDRHDVIDTANRLAWLSDRKEWDALSELFDDEVEVDYLSLTGRPVVRQSREDLVDEWATGLAALDATQHIVTNHLVTVEGEVARCTANFQATHRLMVPFGDPIWMMGGHYAYWMRRTANGWKVSSVTVTVAWSTGNQAVMTLAQRS